MAVDFQEPEQDPVAESPTIGRTESLQLTDVQLKDLSDLFCNEIQQGIEDQADLEMDWDHWSQSYDGRPETDRKSFPWDDASNLVVNLAAIYTDSVVARLMQGIDLDPYWVGTQINKRYANHVKPIEKYLDWCRQHMWDQYYVIKPAILQTCKWGTSFIVNNYIDEQIPTRDGSQRFRAPRPEWVPRQHVLRTPGYTDIQQAPWFAHRRWYSWAELQRLEFSGFFQGISEIKQHDDSEDYKSYGKDFDLPLQNRSGGEFGLWGPWVIWFRKDLEGSGNPQDYILHLHTKSKAVLRVDRNPYLRGLRPYNKLAFVEKEGEFDGIGLCSMVDPYQQEVSTLHNQRVDNATLANMRGIIARKGSGITRRDKMSPGKIFLVTDPATDIKDFKLGEVYPSSFSGEQLTISLAERRVGISDVSMGRESPATGRAAATTVMALLQEGSRRFDLNTAEIRRALGEQGIQILELFQTHGLPEPNEPGAPEQVLDEEDAVLLRQIITETRNDGIRGLLGIKLNVATSAVNKETEKQSNLQLMGVVNQYYQQLQANLAQLLPLVMSGQLPAPMIQAIGAMIMGMDTMMKKVFQAHNAFDLEQILVGDILMQMMNPQQAQIGAPSNGLSTGMEIPQANGSGGIPTSAGPDVDGMLRGLS